MHGQPHIRFNLIVSIIVGFFTLLNEIRDYNIILSLSKSKYNMNSAVDPWTVLENLMWKF